MPVQTQNFLFRQGSGLLHKFPFSIEGGGCILASIFLFRLVPPGSVSPASDLPENGGTAPVLESSWAWGDLLLRNPYSTFLFYSVVVRHCVIHIPHFILLGSSTTQSIFPRIFQHLKIAATLYIPNDFLEYGVKANPQLG